MTVEIRSDLCCLCKEPGPDLKYCQIRAIHGTARARICAVCTWYIGLQRLEYDRQLLQWDREVNSVRHG